VTLESLVGWAPPTDPKTFESKGLHRWSVPTLRLATQIYRPVVSFALS